MERACGGVGEEDVKSVWWRARALIRNDGISDRFKNNSDGICISSKSGNDGILDFGL